MTWANRTAFILACAVVIFTTLAYGAVHQPVLAVFYIMTAVLLVLWAVDGFLSGTVRFSRELLQVPLIATAAYGFLQIIPLGEAAAAGGVQGIPQKISVNPFATQVNALHFLSLFIFFAVLLTLLDSAKRVRRFVLILTVFGFAYAFYAILQSVLSPDKIYGIYESRNATPFGSFVNRHNFAAFMEMALSLPLGLMFAGAVTKDKRLLYITAIALMGVALLLSGSRGGLVAFLAQVIALVLLTTGSKSTKKLALKLALSVVLVAAIIGGAIFVGGETSLTRLAETAANNDLSTGRSHIWGVTLKVVGANMPLGAGLGAFSVAYTPHDSLSGLERVEQAHNDYLQVLSDAGIPGLLIGLGFLILFFYQGWLAGKIENRYKRGVAIGAFAGCFAILIHSIFDFVLHTTAISIMFLALLAIMSASRNKYEDDMDDNQRRRRRSENVSPISSNRRLA